MKEHSVGKICSKCGILKPISNFYIRRDRKDSYRPSCKKCSSIGCKVRYNRDLIGSRKKGRISYNKNKVHHKKYYYDNIDYYKNYHHEYNNSNEGKLKHRISMHKQRSKIFGLRILIDKEIIQKVYEENIKQYGTLTCYLCFKPILFGEDCLEHSVPLCRGGTNEIENLGVAHRSCNSSKRTKTLDEYIEFKMKEKNLVKFLCTNK